MKRFVNHFWPFTMAALITCCAVAQADIVHITESQTIGSIDSPAEGIVLSENREYNVDGNVDYGYIGTFSGNYGLIKSGSGNMTIGYQNTYTGDTTINGGVLYVHTWNKAASELGSGTVTINQGAALCANYINIFGWGGDGWGGSSDDNFPVLNINGGTFTINGCAHLKTLNLNNGTVNYINSNTSGLEFHNRVNNVAKKISSQGTSTISTNITISDPLEIAVSDGTLTINGTINSSTRVAHTGTLTKNGAGMLVLNGLNSYNGDTYVNGGTLRLDACAWNAAGWIGSIKA